MANEGLIFPKLSERQKDLYLKVITNLQTYGYLIVVLALMEFNI